MIRNLFFSFIRKNKALHKSAYEVYFALQGIINKYCSFLPRFKTERLVSKIRRQLGEKGIYEFTFLNNLLFLKQGQSYFVYIPESKGGSIHFITDSSEKFMAELMQMNLDADSVFFDIGSNFGYYAINIAHKLKKGKVFAFEAVRRTFNYLKSNIEFNKLNNISANLLAVSDKNGFLDVTTDKFGCNHISSFKNGHTSCVDSITLDSFVLKNSINRIDMIKCDIEGAEYLVLIGAKESIKKFQPIFFLELKDVWMSRFNTSPLDAFSLFKNYGYTYWLICGNEIQKGSNYLNVASDLSKTINFIFVPKCRTLNLNRKKD